MATTACAGGASPYNISWSMAKLRRFTQGHDCRVLDEIFSKKIAADPAQVRPPGVHNIALPMGDTA